MSNIIYHRHHIIPKHAGGTDDPSNIETITVEEHAERHRILYEKYGRWQDRIAWHSLSGRITSEEARIQAASEANKGRKHTPEHRLKNSEAIKRYLQNNPNNFLGKKHSEESKNKIREARKHQIITKETKQKMSNSRLGHKNGRSKRITIQNISFPCMKYAMDHFGKCKSTIQKWLKTRNDCYYID